MPAGFCSGGGPAAAATARAANISVRTYLLPTLRILVIWLFSWMIRGGSLIGPEARALSSGELFDQWGHDSSSATPPKLVQQEARSAEALRATDCQAVS